MKLTLGTIIVMGGLVVALGGYAVNASTKTTDFPTMSLAAAASQLTSTTASAANAVAPNSPLAPPDHQAAPLGRGVMGQVTAVDGATITVQDQRQQSPITVTLTNSTAIFKQKAIALADAPVGETISAMGQQAGDVFTATQVRIGQTNGGGNQGPGGPPQQGGDHPNGGQPPANGPQGNGTQGSGPQGSSPRGNGPQPGREGGARLFGTIAQVSSDTITVKLADDSTVQLKLATNGQVLQQVAGTSADITVDAPVMAMGERSGSTLTATHIEILPAITQ